MSRHCGHYQHKLVPSVQTRVLEREAETERGCGNKKMRKEGETPRQLTEVSRWKEAQRQKAFIPKVKWQSVLETEGKSQTQRWKETGTAFLLNPTQRPKVLSLSYEQTLLTHAHTIHTPLCVEKAQPINCTETPWLSRRGLDMTTILAPSLYIDLHTHNLASVSTQTIIII